MCSARLVGSGSPCSILHTGYLPLPVQLNYKVSARGLAVAAYYASGPPAILFLACNISGLELGFACCTQCVEVELVYGWRLELTPLVGLFSTTAIVTVSASGVLVIAFNWWFVNCSLHIYHGENSDGT
jgi:hypothetical protein